MTGTVAVTLGRLSPTPEDLLTMLLDKGDDAGVFLEAETTPPPHSHPSVDLMSGWEGQPAAFCQPPAFIFVRRKRDRATTSPPPLEGGGAISKAPDKAVEFTPAEEAEIAKFKALQQVGLRREI